MPKLLTALGGIAVVGVLILLVFGSFVFGTYNGLVTKDENVKTLWGQVESTYQRRFDLVDQLVEPAKASLRQEQSVFNAIAEARTRYAGTSSNSPEQREAMGGFDSALARLLVIVENYPELRSTDVMIGLMDQIEGTENRINVARRRYNEGTQDYNTTIRRIPANIIAGMFGFERAELFEAEEGAEKAPEIDLEVNVE